MWHVKLLSRLRLVITLSVLILIFAVLIVAFFSFSGEAYLVAEQRDIVLFAWQIETNSTFEVTYTHSLNQSPITDTIRWTEDGLVVEKSVFMTFGAGVPIPSDGVGTELLFVDGRYELTGIDKHMPGFYIMTQEVPDHRIKFQGREASLLELAGSGASVYITVKRLPLITRLMAAQK